MTDFSSKTIGILGNAAGKDVGKTLVHLLKLLKEHFPSSAIQLAPEIATITNGHQTIVEGCKKCSSLYELADESDVIFSLGGDGTMLSAARAIIRKSSSTPLIGINLGKLGFIAENAPEDLEQIVRDLADDLLQIEQRLVLHALVGSEENSKQAIRIKHNDLDKSLEGSRNDSSELVALNEIVIDNYGSTRMLTLEVLVDGALLGIMRADGIMIATPTGSTGYSVSAGGPIIVPTSEVMLITPIAPHSLNVRPIVVPADCSITVRASSEETHQTLVVADGQEEIVVPTPAKVTVSAYKDPLMLLRQKKNSYFDLLRNKLFWSIDARDERGLRR